MKNLFAAASYSFGNFYNSLNTRGQMLFTTIIFLIVLLCVILFFTYVIQEVKAKKILNRLKKETINKKRQKHLIEEKNDDTASIKNTAEEVSLKEEVSNVTSNEKTDIESIANEINEVLNETRPINLTNFEEDQEKTAIISIDELYQKAKELEIIDDDNGNVNYLEKYNLEPSEVTNTNVIEDGKSEVKAFKVSQVISPIYGVKKEIFNNDKNK